jgi:hypothetical protein
VHTAADLNAVADERHTRRGRAILIDPVDRSTANPIMPTEDRYGRRDDRQPQPWLADRRARRH